MALKGNDVDKVKDSYEALQSKFHEISEGLYKQASAEHAGRPGTTKQKGEDVVDADYEMVDENKRK